MAEPMSPERLAEIREHAASQQASGDYLSLADFHVRDLLAEVDRLRTEKTVEFADYNRRITDEIKKGAGYTKTIAEQQADIDRLTAERDKAQAACRNLGRALELSGDMLHDIATAPDPIAAIDEHLSVLAETDVLTSDETREVADRLTKIRADRLRKRAEQAEAAIARVRARHEQDIEDADEYGYRKIRTCGYCGTPWPCADIRALTGEEVQP